MYTYWETSGVSVNVNKFYFFFQNQVKCVILACTIVTTLAYHRYMKVRLQQTKPLMYYIQIIVKSARTTEINSYRNAWWQVTFKSLSTIFKISLIFREKCKFSQISKFQKTYYLRRYLGDGLRGRGLPACFHVCIPFFESIYSINAPIFQI